MDRNREARRATMAAAPNGLSRRRHRSSSLRDSPEEDGPVEIQEPARLRDRGLKKDRDRDRDRDRERDRERDRSSRSKKRRENRMMHGGSNREDGGEDTSEESVNDEEEDDDDDGGSGGLRMLPPANPAAAAMSNHHPHQHHRKSFPPTAAKVFRAAVPSPSMSPAWKAADEMIGVSVPRKARSASTKRLHDWISGGGVGGGPEQIHQQSSTSPVRLTPAASPAAAPVSPSSSNVSFRKKIKPNGGAKPRPPKSSSKSSSSNPEELEIEIAEVLYGLMTQSQAPSKKEIVCNDSPKFDSNKSTGDAKSRVSSPISNSTPSTAPPNNSSISAVPLSAVAPKRKRPRQVSETLGNFSVRSSPVSSMKTDIDHQFPKTDIDHQFPKTEVSSPNLENNSGSAFENGVPYDFANLANHQASPASLEPPRPVELRPLTELEGKCGDEILTKEEVTSPKKESPAVRLDDNNPEVVIATARLIATKLSSAVSEIESEKEEKFEIDLMASPPQLRSSPERDGEIDFADHKPMTSHIDTEMIQMVKDKEDEKIGKEDAVNLFEAEEKKKSKAFVEEVEESKKSVVNEERNIDLQLDLEKPDRDCNSVVSGSNSRSQHQVLRHQLPSGKATRDETNTEKNAQPSSLPLPMSVASWPGGLPPMGYVAPLQGVVSMDGNTMPSPIQPIFTQPRPKRCATHCYIARNIHYLQQFMKMNAFWPAAAGSAPIFGAKPPCNLNVMPSPELHGNIVGRSLNSLQDKGQGIAIFPGHTGKDKSSLATSIPDPAQRKQQILLQQALPPVTPNNILHGPAFIFPFNQQQAAVAAASVRPGSAKSTATAGSLAAASSPANSATVSASATAATAMSFNYPNMSPNETQYLAILQNNAYPFPIAAVGAPPNYRGNPHAQAMPLFNGSYYSSQMIHPSQLQQQPPQPPSSQSTQQISQPNQNSSGSSSSQKHLQQIQQQRQQQGAAVNGGSGSGNLQNYPASKTRSTQQPQHQNQHINPPQARHLENEVGQGGEDSPSTADSRVSRAATMSVYGHNFAMPVHPPNFAIMTPPALANATGNPNEKKQQQQQQQPQQRGLKRGVESLPPQTFAMSFVNGSSTAGIDISSMAQNHAILQGLPESSRQNYHQIMAAAAAAHHAQAQPKKNFRISDETKPGGGADSSYVDEDRKVGGGLAGKAVQQSIVFSRSDLTDASGSSSAIPGNSVIDSSARNLNLASASARTSRSPMPNSVVTPTSHQRHQAQLQHQQQQMIQLHKQQQQQNQHIAASLAARSKNPTSNGSAYSDQLITTSSSVAAKFPNSLSSFPQSLVQTSNNSSSPTQSPQWKNSVRTPNSQVVPSSLSSSTTSASLKNLPPQQQQASRTHQQSHTQISFGANQKSSSTSQVQQQSTPNSNNNQCPSPPMLVGSPTTSSISKGAGGSPRTNASASTSNKTGQASSLSSQQTKNSPAVPSQRSSPSILGNPHITSSLGATKPLQQQQQLQQLQQQQQLSKQTLQQAQLFFSHPYVQAQAQAQAQHSGSSTASATSGYYLQRRHPEQQSQPLQQPPATSSTGMLSMCTNPVSLSSASTSDPAKAIAAAAAAASNMKGGGLPYAAQFAAAQSSGNVHHQLMPAGFSYVHAVPAAVQVKPAEQKPAGHDNLHACWQPEKK